MTDPDRDGVLSRSPSERRDLALALLAREDRRGSAREAFRTAYPAAPDEMVETAVHHVYGDGPEAVVDWLADAELFLRDPSHELGRGTSYHLLYHVYNWHQFQALLPDGRDGMRELIAELKEFVADGDLEAIRETVRELEDAFAARESSPDFDRR